MSRGTHCFTWAFSFLAAFFVLGAAQALTYSGYIGVVSLTPAKGALGSGGFVHFEVYSQPSAGGSQVTYAYVCSTGATSNGCDLTATAYGPKYLLTEAQLLVLYKSLVEAAAKGMKVTVTQPSAGDRFQGVAIFPPD
jgi:hypothetical protein